ncbi:MAG: transposase [Deinococcaceae bacterium]
MIESVGGKVMKLPAYGPDLNPIEIMFSKVKAGMRRIGARTQEELEKGLGMVLRAVTAEDARGWFKHSFFPLLF